MAKQSTTVRRPAPKNEGPAPATFYDRNGEALDNPSDDVLFAEYMAAAVAEAGERKVSVPELTEPELVAIVKSIRGDGDEAEAKRMDAILAAEPQFRESDIQPVSATLDKHPQETLAAELAPFMDNPETEARVTLIEDASVTVKEAVGDTLLRWFTDYNVNDKGEKIPVNINDPQSYIIALERIGRMPEPLTGEGEKDRKPQQGGMADKYRRNQEMYRNGEWKVVNAPASFYGDLYDGTVHGKARLEIIRELQDKASERSKSFGNDRERLNALNREAGKRNTMIGKYRQAKQAADKMLEIMQETNNVIVSFDCKYDPKTGETTNVINNGREPVRLVQKNALGNVRGCSFSMLRKLRPSLAKTNTLNGLWESKPDPKARGKRTDSKVEPIPATDLADKLVATQNLLAGSEELRRLAQKHIGGDKTAILAAGDFYVWLTGMFALDATGAPVGTFAAEYVEEDNKRNEDIRKEKEANLAKSKEAAGPQKNKAA